MKIVATLHEYASSLAFRPDGLLMLTAYQWVAQPRNQPGHAKVLVWDWHNNRVQTEISTPATRTEAEAASWRVVVSANGRYAAVFGARPAMVMIWDADLRHQIGQLPAPPDTRSVAFSHDGHRIATTDSDTAVRIWDTNRLQLVLTLADEDRHSYGLAFTRDGRLIAGRTSGGLTIWETKAR
jgi:WD40 repeat protein